MFQSSKTARIDREALSALYHATKGSEWLNNEGWLSNLKLQNWNGVEVNARGRVVKLDLGGGEYDTAEMFRTRYLSWLATSDRLYASEDDPKYGTHDERFLAWRKQLILNNLTGPIPGDLGALSSLKELLLSCNRLDGFIPNNLGDLTVLLKLDLSRNKLTGPIPIELGNLTVLLELDLSVNQLTGRIPIELGNLTALQTLNLRGNKLTGSIPRELGTMTALQSLNLDRNGLAGSIPRELGTMTALQTLYLGDNGLTGSIPRELGRMTALQSLYLYGNGLTGPIPIELGNLTALQTLDLFHNNLTGSIPRELGRMTALQTLFFDGNELTGPIPIELGNLTALQELRLDHNKLTGSIPRELGRMTALHTLILHNNRLTGLGKGEDARVVLELLSGIENLYLGDNPWQCPPAPVVSKGIGPTKKYYDELKRADPVLIDSRKVVFIGRGGAGKTSLIKSIKAGKGQLTQGEELESVGVSVQSHRFDSEVEGEVEGEVDVKLYDLAGQVEYYGLHQLFLTERALYVLVWDASKFMVQKEELAEHLNEWLATLHLRAPHSTVLLCGSHMDKCASKSLLAKLLAWVRRSPPIETVMVDVEQSIRSKHEQWKSERRAGPTSRASLDEGLKLESGIHLVSSSPTLDNCGNGLPYLQERLKQCGKGRRWLIPPSWRLVLVVLDAVRDGVKPMEAVRRYTNREDPLSVVSTDKCSWIHWEMLLLHWKDVQNSPDLPTELRADDPKFVLEIAMELRECGGSLIIHPEVVFLDVEGFALSLAPILNHKPKQRDARGAYVFAGRELDSQWKLDAKERLVSRGILESRFAQFLWEEDDRPLPPQQTFDVLVKLGILLPLPQRREWGGHRVSLSAVEDTSAWKRGDEFLVLMRLPLKASFETMVHFKAFEELREEWGVVAKWEFHGGNTPFGLVERLMASCHIIGNVEPGTCWRGGACFTAHEESVEAAGGSFALALQITENTLIVQVFGHREGRAVWGALRFVISAVWDLFREFPGLAWVARLECPKHNWRLQHHLAGVNDTKGRSPGHPIIFGRQAPHCGCYQGVAARLGTVLRTSAVWARYPLAEVFADQRKQGNRRSNEDEEERFTRALENVQNARKAPMADGATDSESWRVPEWVKDAVFAGPAGALALYEAWSPLSKVVDCWREGSLEQAIPLTIFAVLLAVVGFVGAVQVVRKLRLMYSRWLSRTNTKNN